MEMVEKRKARIQIGGTLPAWVPPSMYLPVRLGLGVIVGLLLAIYILALAFTTDRILTGIEMGAAADDLAFDVAHLVVLILGAFVLRHIAVRGSRMVEEEM